MSASDEVFFRANYLCRRRAYEQWHRAQSKQHILRSQVGFCERTTSRPPACQGCINYHGVTYGTSQATRTTLICAIHPYGWQQEGACPDWQS
ncbi:hypothetical protein XM38_030130 [Halomicronema hongdechloris C2206]|uniref:Uncharacterized protein n=1 Tax=Halomicronema hongdechloris C2206 TaxID=1641165 RepID=A0A1Z3HP41_9CYAN|nr:hypothetical protein [Halomicronema hongdechloris]ASC72059.1 hypothetical protein XM38_030130 [Halomicronema hongdechloris C2206]